MKRAFAAFVAWLRSFRETRHLRRAWTWTLMAIPGAEAILDTRHIFHGPFVTSAVIRSIVVRVMSESGIGGFVTLRMGNLVFFEWYAYPARYDLVIPMLVPKGAEITARSEQRPCHIVLLGETGEELPPLPVRQRLEKFMSRITDYGRWWR